MEAGVAASIAASIVDILIDMWQGIVKKKNILLSLMAPLAFIASFIFDVNVVYIIIFTAVLCFSQAYLGDKFSEREDLKDD